MFHCINHWTDDADPPGDPPLLAVQQCPVDGDLGVEPQLGPQQLLVPWIINQFNSIFTKAPRTRGAPAPAPSSLPPSPTPWPSSATHL